jgi:hypothetical protein
MRRSLRVFGKLNVKLNEHRIVVEKHIGNRTSFDISCNNILFFYFYFIFYFLEQKKTSFLGV